jgi:hypothetical protein
MLFQLLGKMRLSVQGISWWRVTLVVGLDIRSLLRQGGLWWWSLHRTQVRKEHFPSPAVPHLIPVSGTLHSPRSICRCTQALSVLLETPIARHGGLLVPPVATRSHNFLIPMRATLPELQHGQPSLRVIPAVVSAQRSAQTLQTRPQLPSMVLIRLASTEYHLRPPSKPTSSGRLSAVRRAR